MSFIIGFVFIFCFLLFPVFRCALFSLPYTVSYGVKDFIRYIKHREWGVAPYGRIICYIADGATSFGCGKTLSVVDYLVSLYKRYDGVMVYDARREKWVKQRIHILSNVDFLTVPYEKLVNLEQFVQETNEDFLQTDQENDTLTVTYMLIDEASSQLNSRDFKNNFNGLFISRLLTARHVRASVYLTSQRSGMVDKLMREVTNLYIGCNKIWRFQINNYYDAYEIENATSPSLVTPLRKTCWFVKDSAFKNYDTYSSVKTLEKQYKEGRMMTDAEILELQGNQDLQMDAVKRPSRLWQRRQKKK